MTVFTRAEDVAAEIARRVSTIRTADGFETDIGASVREGRLKVPADDEVPCAQIIEGNDDVDDEAGRTQVSQVKVSKTFVIDGYDACDRLQPNKRAHMMIRDIKRVLFHGGRTLGGKVREISYRGSDIGPRPDGAGYVQARVAVRVTYAEDLANP